jgi:hypothetical protein
MGQASVAEAAKIYSKDRTYMGLGNNTKGQDATINILNAITDGYQKTFTNPANWEEAF